VEAVVVEGPNPDPAWSLLLSTIATDNVHNVNNVKRRAT